MRRLTLATFAGTGSLALLASWVLSGSGTGDGVRLEGSPAASATRGSATSGDSSATGASGGDEVPETGRGDSTERGRLPTSPASPAPAQRPGDDDVRPKYAPQRMVELLKNDPKVSPEVKSHLKPCAGDRWPVSVQRGKLTGPREDMVVNVSSCADSVGVGTYVYRRSSSGTLVNVFSAERPPVHATIKKGRLVVTRDVYIGNEPMCCPSGRDIITYVWQDGVFHQVARKRTNSAGEPAPAVDAVQGRRRE